MLKNQALEEMVLFAEKFFANWDSIINRYKRMALHKKFPEPTNISHYYKCFSEIYLDFFIENFSRKNKQFHIELNFIKGREKIYKSDKFRFESTDDKRLLVFSKFSGDSYTEYDKVVLVDNLPVCFEIKIARHFQVPSKFNKNSTSSLIHVAKPEYYLAKLAPLIDFFERDIGYAIMIPKDEYFKKEFPADKPSPIYNQFKLDNGIFLPFYTNRFLFKSDVRQNVREYGLNLKEISIF